MCLPVSTAPETVSPLCCCCSLILFIGQQWLPLPQRYPAQLPVTLQDVLVTRTCAACLEPSTYLPYSPCGQHYANKSQLVLPQRLKPFQLSSAWKHSWVLFIVWPITENINRYTAEQQNISPTPSAQSMWNLNAGSVLPSYQTWGQNLRVPGQHCLSSSQGQTGLTAFFGQCITIS